MMTPCSTFEQGKRLDGLENSYYSRCIYGCTHYDSAEQKTIEKKMSTGITNCTVQRPLTGAPVTRLTTRQCSLERVHVHTHVTVIVYAISIQV